MALNVDSRVEGQEFCADRVLFGVRQYLFVEARPHLAAAGKRRRHRAFV
jgi:hypothetical protein